MLNARKDNSKGIIYMLDNIEKVLFSIYFFFILVLNLVKEGCRLPYDGPLRGCWDVGSIFYR